MICERGATDHDGEFLVRLEVSGDENVDKMGILRRFDVTAHDESRQL